MFRNMQNAEIIRKMTEEFDEVMKCYEYDFCCLKERYNCLIFLISCYCTFVYDIFGLFGYPLCCRKSAKCPVIKVRLNR